MKEGGREGSESHLCYVKMVGNQHIKPYSHVHIFLVSIISDCLQSHFDENQMVSTKKREKRVKKNVIFA